MLSTVTLAALALAGVGIAQNTATSTADVAAAAATAKTSSPTSDVCGSAFDRFVTIWLENTDFSAAQADPNLAWLASKGVTLENYFGVTHPSEPNYIAAIGGDNFGLDGDPFVQIANNVSTVIDLLESRGISWSEYQEDLPYSGFEGFAWVNQQTKANDYVRKHNPAVIYNANTSPERLARIKNITMFQEDLKNDKLPQWMFITPNMTSDGHDTSVTTAGTWTRNFLEPLLNNKNFMKRTLVLVTFDENHTYTQANRVFSILLGDAVPQNLVGTKDDTFYNHYSEIATVEANWNLPTLGRWDVGANVFQLVADHTGDKNRAWPAVTGANPTRFLNQSFAGPFNSVKNNTGYPVPNVLLNRHGRVVFPEVFATWALEELKENSYYQNTVQIPDGLAPPKGWSNH
ncbi:acid phosphatase phoa [Myriangium duriaei CBS 260.36]|uniref:Acid phosphatase phoa n=1 Tax=Myriangium duriaei CBS 260.36 TaxID=1168546 RepID=A0A9P4J068_9PEZI|nr:acid phosphatase phoa [Myriangium duriaei CBS 260.36]